MPILKRTTIVILIAALLMIIFTGSSSAATLPFSLTWDRNTEPDVAFYTVYYGTASRNYSHIQDVTHPSTSCDFCDSSSPGCDVQITEPGTYYITVTATDSALNESGYSSELEVYIDPPTTTTTSPATTTTTLSATPTLPTTTIIPTAPPSYGITYEDAEDGTNNRWTIYDDSPSGAQIRNLFDRDRQSHVIQFSGSGTDNGYRLTNSDGTLWNNSSHFTVQWSMNFAESFIIYIDLETTAGHRYLQYEPFDYNSWGYGEYVDHGLGTDVTDGQWHTFVRNLQADLNVAQPGVTILEVNGFLIRGNGMVDDIMLLDSTTASPPNYGITYEDAEDGVTNRWHVYDNSPSGAQIRNLFDSDRQSRVIQFSGAGWENGYRLTTGAGNDWHNSHQFVVEWSMKYSDHFTAYLDLETTAGHRFLQYEPFDYNTLGDGEYVGYGLGEDAKDGQWHTYVRNLQADLNAAQPGVTILEVNGFLIRGSGMVDDIMLLDYFPSSSTTTTSIAQNSPSTTTIPSSPGTTPIGKDTTPPTGTITINKGAAYTDCELVTLYLSAEDPGSGMGEGAQMMFSKHSNKDWSDPMPFEPVKTWTISGKKGVKRIYARFSDAAGNWMDEPVVDSIALLSYCDNPIQLSTSFLESSGTFLPNSSGNKIGGNNTGWFSPLRLFQHDEYITLDLGETKIVNRLDISSSRFLLLDLFPQDFEIQASTDNQNWEVLFAVENYTPPSSRLENWAFESTEARYIRMVVTKAKPFFLFFYLSYVADIKVSGCGETETTNPELVPTSSFDQTETGQTLDLQAIDEKNLLRNPAVIDNDGKRHTNGSHSSRNEYSRIHTSETSGIICDNEDLCTSSTGIWEMTDAYDSYQNSSLVPEKGATFTWKPDLPQAGTYSLYMWWSSGIANCSSCPVYITCNGELRDILYLDQRQDGGQWNLLGTYNFEEGNGCTVKIISEGSNLKASADAVKLVHMGENTSEARIAFIQPNPAYSDEEICLGGYGIPANGMTIQDYSWLSNLDGEIGTTSSFCTSSLSEGTHRISLKVQDDDGTWSTPVEKAVTIVNIAPSQKVWLEAEDETIAPPMEAAWDDNASNGEYIRVPNGGGNVTDPLQDGGYAEYNFEVFEAGYFVVWGRVTSNGLENNSFWISVDNGAHALWDIRPGSKDTWVWDRVSNRGVSGPAVYHLDEGLHTLVIKNREDGTRIDKILVTNDIKYKPTGKGE